MARCTWRPRQAAVLPALAILAGLVSAGCAGVPAASSGPVSRSPRAAAHSSPRPTARTPRARAPRSPFAGALAAYLRGRQGEVTAAVYDARTKKTWVYHPGVLEYTASIVKVEIMGTVFQLAQQGTPLSAADQGLLVPMIEASDNNAASALLQAVGGPPGVRRFDLSAGLADTSPADTTPPIPGTPWPGWGLTTTTARDQVTLLKRFAYPNAVITPANREQGLRLMKAVEAGQNWGVTAGVLPGTTVAVKNGWVPFPQALAHAPAGWQIDSIGWVDGNGRNYVIAVLTNGNSSEQYGIDTIEAISRAVFTALAPKAG